MTNPERLEFYYSVYPEPDNDFITVLVGAADRHLPEVVGSTVKEANLHREDTDGLALTAMNHGRSVMVPALQIAQEKTPKLSILRLSSAKENGLSFTYNRVQSNRSKQRGKRKNDDTWHKEGALAYLNEVHPVTELTFSAVSLRRHLAAVPSQKKAVCLEPSESSSAALGAVQAVLQRGIEPTLQRDTALDDTPLCIIGEVDVSNAKTANVKEFLYEVESAMPLSASLGRLALRYDTSS